LNKYTTIRVEKPLYLQFVDRVRRREGNVSLTTVMMRLIERYLRETETVTELPTSKNKEVA
jgi:Tfp pilus assembly protein PilE